MKIFRGCCYEVLTNAQRWSRHSSLKAANRSFREAVNNQRRDHEVGTFVELCDVEAGVTLETGTSRW